MKKWFFLLSIPFFVCCKPIYLIDKLKNSQKGDYFVLQTGKNATILHIQNINKERINLEEISFPLKKLPNQLQEYLAKLAPNHTSWTQTLFDLQEIKVEKCYSFVQQSFLDVSNIQNFFSTLIQLPFEFIEENRRKKIGLEYSDSLDMRKNWTPPLPKGISKTSSAWEVYRARWPKDGSDLSDKVVEIYLYEEYLFPLWIEIKSAAYKGKLRVIDLGRGLQSPLFIPHKK